MMQEQLKFNPIHEQISQKIVNPQKQNASLKNKSKSFRKRKYKIKKSKQMQIQKQSDDNPLYQGLQNQEKSKNNEKNLGPWVRLQGQQNVQKNSQVLMPMTGNKIKFIADFSQNVFYPKRSLSTQITDNKKQEINRKNYTNKKPDVKILSIRNAILEEQQDFSLQLPKVASSKQLPKFHSVNVNSMKLLPIMKSQKDLFRPKHYLQIRKGPETKQHITVEKKNMKSLLQKKLNGTLENFSISPLKTNNIELKRLKNSSKLASIIHSKKKF